MIDDFDHIIQKLLSELPQHTPKSDVWRKINEKLDEDISMSRLRKILKSTEHSPKQDIWSNIETALDKSLVRKPFYNSNLFRISLSSLIIGGTALVFILMNNPFKNNIKLAKTNDRIINVKSIDPRIQGNYNKPDKEIFIQVNDLPATKNDRVLPSAKPDAVFANVDEPVIPNNINNLKQQADKINSVNDDIKNKDNNKVHQIIDEPKETPINAEMQKIESRYCSYIDLPGITSGSIKDTASIPLNPASTNTPNIKAQAGFSLELFAAPEVSFTRYTDNPKNDINLDLNSRKNSDHAAFSRSYGAELKMDLHHWFFQSGINYSIIQSCSMYKSNTPGNDTTGWVLGSATLIPKHDSAEIIIPAHYIYTWVPRIGTTSQSDVKKAVSEIRFIQVPLIAGYGFSYRKFMFSVGSGISVGIPVSYRGEIVNADNSGLSELSQVNTTLRKPGFDYLLRAGITYVYSSRYSLFAQPSFSYSLNSIFTKANPVNQKYSIYGVRLGMLYRF
jgi:hypothetical protein